MKIKLKHIAALVVLVVIAYVVYLYIQPGYPDIATPKPDFGNEDASVKIVEFSDLQCPACGNAHPDVKRLLEEYGDVVSFKYFHFPLQSIHPHAQKAAEAAECANDQGKMKEYIDIAFENQHALTTSDLKQYAQVLGLDQESFNACLDSSAKRDHVEADFRAGLARNVDSTPTFFINNVKIEDRSYAAMSAQIESLLN